MPKPGVSCGVIPFGPFVRLKPAEVVAVAGDLRQDLAEAERHDREVVAAQAQRRQADHDPEERGDDPRDQEDEEERDVDAAGSDRDADPAEAEVGLRDQSHWAVGDENPAFGHFCPANCDEANQAAV